ncbi:unnamed protein product [Rhizoctonia solani]|uniref:Oligopeptide transporter 5 n=1 Tax=Rhizoctonia solani TaxID=456999 RepID=A0A8H3GEQ4_9AGAM|nr:unnamed protein product [Rhizoctonia solani]
MAVSHPDNRPRGPHVVVESAEFIVSHSKLVELNHSGINRVAEQIDKQTRSGLYSPHTWSEQPLHHLPPWPLDENTDIFSLESPARPTIDWVFLVSLLNFSFWSTLPSGERFAIEWLPPRSLDGNTRWEGYWALPAALNRALENGIPITDPKFYASQKDCPDGLIEKVFQPAPGCLETIPLLEERIRVMRQAGAILVEKYNGSFSGILAEWRQEHGPKATAGVLVANITKTFGVFRDENTYKDRLVFFWKRAQILVAETWAAFYPPPDAIVSHPIFPLGVTELTMFADYRVPQILHHLGTIDYSPALASMLVNGENLPNGSEAEMSIRAAGILAVEAIKNRILDIRRHKPATNSLDSEGIEFERTPVFFGMALPESNTSPKAIPSNLITSMPVPDPQLASTVARTDQLSPQSEVSVEKKFSPGRSTSKDLIPSLDEKLPLPDVDSYSDDVKLVNGQPVIETGAHVSNFAVDVRDDGDPSLTWRSFWIGTVVAGLGAALYQIYIFKPIDVSVSGIFLLLLVYTIGNAWAILLPKPEQFENRIPWLVPIHAVATLIATTAAYGATAVNIFAVQRLFYNAEVNAATAVLATFSTACFGYGIVGILRPLTVYPSEMVYWGNLPTVTTFQALHWDKTATSKRLKLFWSAFGGMAVYEILPAYIFPLLNGFSVFCLASQKASTRVRTVFTNIFGGASGNEGLGLLSLSFDWQYIGSTYMSLPLIQQGNSWIGYGICYIAILAIYYSNTWDAKSLPMLSTSIFGTDGKRYNQTAVFGPTFTLNHTALEEHGLPHLTGSNVWTNMTACWSIGGLIAHCVWFWRGYVIDSFKQARTGTQPDRHWVAMQRYKECPWWWYLALLLLSFFGGFVAPFSNLLYARLGNGIATNQLMKMVAGAVHPGKPVANLYFSMWSHDVISTSIGLAGDLKMGQYLKIPPRVMFLTQMWGTLLGAFVNYAVMVSITSSRREVLLNPIGTNVWSGATVQSLNSAAVTWSLAGELYGLHGPYKWVPIGLGLGMIPTTIQYFIWKRWPKIGPVEVDKVMLPVIYMYAGWFSSGVNSITTSVIIVGLLSQVWLRRRHPGWYNKYNYILGGGLDGGTQTMVFILSFAVYGASGIERPFPNWWGNPADINPDYCL